MGDFHATLPAEHVWFSRAICDVGAERRRHVEVEGFTIEHDDQHRNGEMARASAAYALQHAAEARAIAPSELLVETIRSCWPWERKWWKPGVARDMLVKAAALLIAEIERLDRKAAREGGAS